MELQEAVTETIYGFKGGPARLAEFFGLSSSMLYKAANPNDETQLKLLMLPALLKATGDPRIVRVLARVIGYSIIKMPKRIPRVGPKTVMSLQAELLKLLNTLTDYADGGASRADAINAVWAVIESLFYLKKILEAGQELPIETAQVELPGMTAAGRK